MLMLGTQSAVNPRQYSQGYGCKYHQAFLEGSLELCAEIAGFCICEIQQADNKPIETLKIVSLQVIHKA